MTWRHPSPNMTSDGLLVDEPRCRPRVYWIRVTGDWTFYCAQHPRDHRHGTWDETMAAALTHARTAPRPYRAM